MNRTRAIIANEFNKNKLLMIRYKRIETILIDTFKPLFLQIENESHRHQVPKESETHFKITIVTSDFFLFFFTNTILLPVFYILRAGTV